MVDDPSYPAHSRAGSAVTRQAMHLTCPGSHRPAWLSCLRQTPGTRVPGFFLVSSILFPIYQVNFSHHFASNCAIMLSKTIPERVLAMAGDISTRERGSPMQHVARVVMVMIGLQLSLASSLWAFAVGDIAVHSRRGEPFAADIRLLLEARERDKEIEVTLGNQDAYRGEGVKRPAVIDTLQAVLPPGTRDVIRLSSTVPLQETAFDLVLLVRVGQVTIMKHYAVAIPAPAPTAVPSVASLPTIAPVSTRGFSPQNGSPRRRVPHSGQGVMGQLGEGRRSTALPNRCACPMTSSGRLWSRSGGRIRSNSRGAICMGCRLARFW